MRWLIGTRAVALLQVTVLGSQTEIDQYKRMSLKRRGMSVGDQTKYGMDAQGMVDTSGLLSLSFK